MSVPAPRKNFEKTPWPEIFHCGLWAIIFLVAICESIVEKMGMTYLALALNATAFICCIVIMIGYFRDWWAS